MHRMCSGVTTVRWLHSFSSRMLTRSILRLRVTTNSRLSCDFSNVGSNTFYDSQSGGFITRPGSQGTRIHDSKLKCTDMGSSASAAASKYIVDYIRDASRLSGVSSVSLPLITSDELYKQYMNASVPYLIRNQAQIKVKVASQPRNLNQVSLLSDVVASNGQAKNVLETEIDILANKNTQVQNETANQLISSLPQLSSQGLVTRVNVLVSIDPFITNNESELLSVIEMGELFARLCDAGVKVINISLCSSNDKTGLLEPAVVDNILDYLREILEEGLNLDVSGDALLERLSVQCTDESVLPGVVELVLGLGITRFTTSSRVNGNIIGEGLTDHKGRVVLYGETSPCFALPSIDAVSFAEKFLK